MKNRKTVIDVRRPEEYAAGHAEGSRNIPLQEIENHLDEIRQIAQPVVLCCGGGTRSGKAAELLRSHGINCENGGSWKDVSARQNNGEL